MPTKKISATTKKTIEVGPALADLDIREAIEWLNRRIAQYDHANVDSFKIADHKSYAWHRHDAPDRVVDFYPNGSAVVNLKPVDADLYFFSY